jgi:RimJ/RimL family protein N-acetyltransferase
VNPILIDVPSQLETERLLLRAPLQSGEGKTVNAAIKDSHPELKAWLPFAQTLPTPEETEANLREAHVNFLKRESLRYLIFHKQTKAFIGTMSLHELDWQIPKGEIGYWIATKHSGHGYMVEAVKALTSLGMEKLKFRRIDIRCESTNDKSRSLAERAGFKLEGTLRNEDFSADGKRVTDTCIYAIVQ